MGGTPAVWSGPNGHLGDQILSTPLEFLSAPLPQPGYQELPPDPLVALTGRVWVLEQRVRMLTEDVARLQQGGWVQQQWRRWRRWCAEVRDQWSGR